MGAKLPKGIHHKHDKKESAKASPSKRAEPERPFTVGQPCFVEGQSTWWWDLPVELQVIVTSRFSPLILALARSPSSLNFAG